ncbi:MAG: sigma-54-dependent Fis family transcriptional regulator [Planctomycetota bacterium]
MSESEQVDRGALLALMQASQAVADGEDAIGVCRLLAERAAAVLAAEGASVLLLDPSGKRLRFEVVTGPGEGIVEGMAFDAAEGIAGQVTRTGRAVRVDDVGQNRNFFPDVDQRTKTRTRSLMAAPLSHRGRVIGVVEVINPTDQPRFTDRDLELFRVFANLTAAAAANAQTIDRLERTNRTLRSSALPGRVVGESRAMKDVLSLCRKVASASTNVLLTGASGTGKEVAARTIHTLSPRRDLPFVAVNCAAFSESLLESELFGHEKGAFTGASEQRAGVFEAAEGGTLFLDEIGELPAGSQAKLLRVLQERRYMRVGGSRELACDVRIIAATNRDLAAEATLGRFREDLYYRLSVFPIEMPRLADRRDDIRPLAEHFLEQVRTETGVGVRGIAEPAWRRLESHDWPGNIRELRNVIERAALVCDGRIEVADLALPRRGAAEVAVAAADSAEVTAGSSAPVDGEGGEGGEAAERRLVVEALDAAGWNVSAAARRLGVSRDVVRYRVRKFGLTRPPLGRSTLG